MDSSELRELTAPRVYNQTGRHSRSGGPTTPVLAVTLVNVYAVALAAAAAALAVVLLELDESVGSPLWALVILGALAVAAERLTVRVSATTEMSVSVLPLLFAAVIYGPVAAMIVGGIGVLADFRAPYVRWMIWTSTRVLSAGLAGLAASVAADDLTSLAGLFAAVFAAALVEVVTDAMLGSLTLVIRGRATFHEFVRCVRPILLATVPLYTPVVVILGYAYIEISEWSLLLFFAPAVAAQSLYQLYREQREAAGQLRVANNRLERANLSFATALVATLDARDQYTAGHSAAVAIYARDIAKRIGLSDEQQQLVHLCGSVHDIGKIGLPAGLLEKPGALTLDERRRMEKHSEIAERILSNVEDYAEIAMIVRHHHERVDGHGYPDGVEGEAIPLLSRIIAVADAYNAMTSDRPYRDAMPSRVARLRLAQAVETQFDTAVVAAFEALLAGASEDYRLGTRSDFMLMDQDAHASRAAA
jgi:HD-GYP domain-containing protein (c-di-GMP phosphodiesterase class II)